MALLHTLLGNRYTILHNAVKCDNELVTQAVTFVAMLRIHDYPARPSHRLVWPLQVQSGIILLLGKGLSVNTISNDRKTALHLALEHEQANSSLC